VRLLQRLGAVSLLLALTLLTSSLYAQTLDQAEALWKARRFKEANEVFKALEAKNPKNADVKVRWGRMMLDHAQPTDAQRQACSQSAGRACSNPGWVGQHSAAKGGKAPVAMGELVVSPPVARGVVVIAIPAS